MPPGGDPFAPPTDDAARPPAVAAGTEAEAAARDANPQYVLPLVVRIERAAPPQRTDALETAARAVLTFLADPRSTDPDGEWTPLVEAWTDGRIRKVVRRARGAEWTRAEALPGITVTGTDAAPAHVRVFPPVPLDGWPKDLSRLQVSGTDLTDAEPPAPVEPGSRPILWLNPELEMTAGKAMAQVGHAAQLAWWRLSEAQRKAWADDDFRLAVRVASRALWPALADSDRPVVRDAGFTEIAPGSCTVVADVPALGELT
ncbi:MAG: peptidyl-tRNA hydrolase [Catenulispora sp.]|nr:peptidyl-tRNA hydrolase [Catenulispora sp.]